MATGKRLIINTITNEVTEEEILFQEPTPQALAKEEARAELIRTDSYIPRIVEDLIDLLIVKGVISETELPLIVQQKLSSRKALRKMPQGELLKKLHGSNTPKEEHP